MFSGPYLGLLLPATEVYSACALLCVLHSQCEVSGTDTDDELR